MGPKKASPIKDGKVAKKPAATKKVATKKAATKTPTKTPTQKASKASTKRKFVKAECGGIDAKNAQGFATYTWTLYLDSSEEPIAVIESAMPPQSDVHWCSATGPVFSMDLSVMCKDGHKFVCNY
jgi:hypothetical protein